MSDPRPPVVPIFKTATRVPDRVGALFKVDARPWRWSLIRDDQEIRADAGLAASYRGTEASRFGDGILRPAREDERLRLRRRGIASSQTSAKVKSCIVSDEMLTLSPALLSNTFRAEVENLKRLLAPTGIELLATGSLEIPPIESGSNWLWAAFRYRAIAESDGIDPHDRILHVAMSLTDKTVMHVLYGYSFLRPEKSAFSEFALFLFEWAYSVTRCLADRPPIPVGGYWSDPYWVQSVGKLRTLSPLDIKDFVDGRRAVNRPYDWDRVGRTPDSVHGVRVMPTNLNDPTAFEAWITDPRNPDRHTIHHESSHVIERSLMSSMELDLGHSSFSRRPNGDPA
jgi:hypothetical protein